MKILIIGGGSIGQRHLGNLKTLGVQNIGVVDLDQGKLKTIREKYGVETYPEIKEALGKKWDASFVCTPPVTHVKLALALIDKQIPVFIEKPLAGSIKEADILLDGIKKSAVSIMIGYNLNFHPQFQKIKQLLDKNVLGNIWGIRAEFGQYLPDWHPWEDYRKGYSARKDLGGGIVLDDVHEIDYLYSLFGKVKSVFAFAEKVSKLEIDTEDYAEIVLNFKNNVVGSVHMDYLQREGSRFLKIIGEKGTLEWDIKNNKFRYYLSEDKKWIVDTLSNFDFNKTYVDEIKHFIDCVNNNKRPEPDLKRGYETLKIASAIKKSSKLKKPIIL